LELKNKNINARGIYKEERKTRRRKDLILPARSFNRLIFIAGVAFALCCAADGFLLFLAPLFCSGYKPSAFSDFTKYSAANDFFPETA